MPYGHMVAQVPVLQFAHAVGAADSCCCDWQTLKGSQRQGRLLCTWLIAAQVATMQHQLASVQHDCGVFPRGWEDLR